jgi:opacity protein-like surface antigen
VNAGLTDQSKIDLLSSVTGRFGCAWDRLLTYAKAAARGRTTNMISSLLITRHSQRQRHAQRLDGGGGFEYAVTYNFFHVFEYNYYDFGTRTVGLTSVTSSSQLVDVRERESLIKVGTNWKFNWRERVRCLPVPVR